MKRWRGPEYPGEFPSLGWGVVDVIEEYLQAPSGLHRGDPFKLTDRQIEFVVRAHRIDPVSGRYVNRRAVLEGPKGDGKSPLLGAVMFAHFVGPVVFGGWDAHGDPVGIRHPSPWIQIAGLAEDQTDNCYEQLRAALTESKAIDEFRIDFGLTRVYLIGDTGPVGTLEPVTSSSGAREGQPITGGGKEEIHLWTPSRRGPELSRVLDRNLVKTGGLSFAATNTFRRGEGSVGELEEAAAAKGARGLLYVAHRGDYVEDLTDRELVRKSVDQAYDPEAHWIDRELIVDAVGDETVPPGERRRFYLNIPDEFTEDSWLPEGCWQSHRRKGRRINLEQPFAAAIDMALKHDTTALRVGQFGLDGKIVTESFLWVPEYGKPLDIDAIEAKIIELQSTGNLQSCAYDPAFFERSAQALAERGVTMVEFPQSIERMVPACGHAYELIVGGQVVHDDDEVSEAQVVMAVPSPAGRGWTLKKNKQTRHKIDSAVALVMMLDELCRYGEPASEKPAPFMMTLGGSK